MSGSGSDQRGTATKVMDVMQRAFAVCAVVLLLGGVATASIGKQDRGFTLIAFAVIVGGLLLVLHLYRGRYRL
jgi:uncharacterized membrane protein YiaA